MTDDNADLSNEEFLRAYRLTFGPPWGQQVLAHLAKFCRAGDTGIVPPRWQDGPVDVHRTMVLAGRREVFIHIQRALSLTPDQIMKLLGGSHVKIGEPDA